MLLRIRPREATRADASVGPLWIRRRVARLVCRSSVGHQKRAGLGIDGDRSILVHRDRHAIEPARCRTTGSGTVVGEDGAVAGAMELEGTGIPRDRATKVDALPIERLDAVFVVDDVELAVRIAEGLAFHRGDVVGTDGDLTTERTGLVWPEQGADADAELGQDDARGAKGSVPGEGAPRMEFLRDGLPMSGLQAGKGAEAALGDPATPDTYNGSD